MLGSQGIVVKSVIIFFAILDCGYQVNNFIKRVYVVAFCCVTDKTCFLTALKGFLNKEMFDPFCWH